MISSGAKEFPFDLNPYDSFIKRHLQHYGYFTDRCGKTHPITSYDAPSDSNSSDTESDDSYVSGSSNNVADHRSRGVPRTTQLVYSVQAGRMVVQLREPRQLYGLYSGVWGPQQPARWPSGIQVILDRVRHITWHPPEPEPFYKPTGQEAAPLAISHRGHGRVVYEYEPMIGNFFVRSNLSGNAAGYLEPASVDLESDDDATLLFESRFESANLAKAVQVGPFEYELWLRPDLYTGKHTQWYYFMVSNTRTDVTYRFTIVNLMKPESLYNYGMRPLMYSEWLAENQRVGWIRAGSDIKYYRNNITYPSGKVDKPYYSLTWTFTCPRSNDTVYFAHCYPYTYSDLQDYINDIVNDPTKSKYCRHRLLCRTLAGNLVYLLTITSPMMETSEDAKQRKAVVLTARVHPGETNSSWMMKGFLDFLLSGSKDAKLLCDTFVFKIVPMLNPDGVIVGNYRCSLTGRDLNRNYKSAFKDSFPSIWHTKNMIKSLLDEREVIIYCDLHGHSRRHNVFLYGCENRFDTQRRLRERVFPYMLSRNAPDMFNFDRCKFHVQKNKEGTGRVVMWNLGIQNSYTLEATFCGSSIGKSRGFHFTSTDFESMGFSFCDTLLDYCDPDIAKINAALSCIEERVKSEIFQRLKQQQTTNDLPKDPSDIDLSKHYVEEIESSDGGSDSSVSDGLPVQLDFMSAKMRGRKKRLKSRKERNRNKGCHSAAKDLKRSQMRGLKEPEVSDKTDKKNRKPSSTISSAPFRRHCKCTDSDVPGFLQERLEDGNGRKIGSETAIRFSHHDNNSVPRDNVVENRFVPTAKVFGMPMPSTFYDGDKYTMQRYTSCFDDCRMPPDGIRGKSMAPSCVTLMPFLPVASRLLQRQALEGNQLTHNGRGDNILKCPSLTLDHGLVGSSALVDSAAEAQTSAAENCVTSKDDNTVTSVYVVSKPNSATKELIAKRLHVSSQQPTGQPVEFNVRKVSTVDHFQEMHGPCGDASSVHHHRHASSPGNRDADQFDFTSCAPVASSIKYMRPSVSALGLAETETSRPYMSKSNSAATLCISRPSQFAESEGATATAGPQRLNSSPQLLPRRRYPTPSLKRPGINPRPSTQHSSSLKY